MNVRESYSAALEQGTLTAATDDNYPSGLCRSKWERGTRVEKEDCIEEHIDVQIN